MPKEITYSDSGPFVRLDDGNEYPPSDERAGKGLIRRRGVHVGWSREQFVEVGVAEFCTATGEAISGEGYYLTLDRAGINRVIRALRKARDQAFGRDE